MIQKSLYQSENIVFDQQNPILKFLEKKKIFKRQFQVLFERNHLFNLCAKLKEKLRRLLILFTALSFLGFCFVNLGIFLFQHFRKLIPFYTFTMIDEVKCSLALIVLGFYVYAKFFPIFQYHLNSFCMVIATSNMKSCTSIVIFRKTPEATVTYRNNTKSIHATLLCYILNWIWNYSNSGNLQVRSFLRLLCSFWGITSFIWITQSKGAEFQKSQKSSKMPELEFECDTIFTLRNQFPTTFVLGVLTEM